MITYDVVFARVVLPTTTFICFGYFSGSMDAYDMSGYPVPVKGQRLYTVRSAAYGVMGV